MLSLKLPFSTWAVGLDAVEELRDTLLHISLKEELLSISCGGTGQQWTAAGAGALGAADMGMAPAWRRSPLTPHRAARTYTGLGKQTLGGHRQKLVGTRSQEKGAVTLQETDPDLPVSVQESPAEVWIGVGLLQVWGH